MVKFRFQDLEIWKMAIDIADELFDIADELEKKDYIDLLSNYVLPACQCQTILLRDLVRIQRMNSFTSST